MRRFSFLTLLTSLLIVSCTEVTIEQSNPLTEINSLPDLTASFADEGETRTFVEDSKYLRWHEADLITAFFGNTLNRQYKFKGKTGDNSGTFSLVPSGELGAGNDLSSIYAVYPYDENTTITDNGVISLTLPATQTYTENSFGKGANTMVAVTESVEDTFLSFKNACGYLKLKLYGDNVTIASIEVKGNNEEKIAGSATATMEFGGVPTITLNDEATTSVTLDCGEGVSIGATADTATEFWIVLPETTFEGGITITATNTDGAVFSKSTTNTVVITRNDIQPMVALKAEFATAKPANNEIWYTNGSATEATAPYATDVFGANIISNTYDADKQCWVIKFDGDVTLIGYEAFYSCDSLESITIPNSVTTIEWSAFRFCESLTSVTIGDSVTSIGSHAFSMCTSLQEFKGNLASEDGRCLIIGGVLQAFAPAGITEYTIPDGVTAIGPTVFNPCPNLTSVTIPNSVTTIGEYAFDYCKSLTSITIPDSVTTIGESAFSDCSSLTSVTIGNSVTTIGEMAFSDCSSLTSITIPDSVTSIGYYAFDSCSSLESVTIGNSVTTIGDSAFRNCSNLTGVYITDIAAWCNISFETFRSNPLNNGGNLYINNELVADLTIPDSVTTIGYYAFIGCSSLTSVTIPNSVIEIEGWAFDSCSSLESVTIPDGVTTIGNSAFYSCTALQEVYCKATTPPTATGGLMFDDNALDRMIYVPAESVELYKGADRWSNYADYIVGYNFETGEVVPETPVRPANNEIWYTNGKTTYTSEPAKTDVFGANIISNTYDAQKECWVIKFDGDVTTIGSGAFYECPSLESVTIPDSVTSIGSGAFEDCYSLESVTIPDNVTSIGYYAFYNCTSLTSVTIPDSVTAIEGYAFADCPSLTSVTIPDSVTTIGGGAFYNCTSLTSVTIGNGVTEIGEGAFSGCSSLQEFNGDFASEDGRCLIIDGELYSFASAGLTEYSIPDSVTSIGSYAFSFCDSLTSVTIPDSVTTIGESAFHWCSNLKEFNSKSASNDGRCLIIDGVLYSFAPAELTEYAIPNGVTAIGRNSFSGCSSLTSVTIPDSVTSIGDSAFNGCSSLTSVYCKPTTPPEGGYSMFYNNASGQKIYVPSASVSAYKSATYWKTYASDIVGYNF